MDKEILLSEIKSLKKQILSMQVELARLDTKIAEHCKLRWEHIEEISDKISEIEKKLK